MTKKVDLLFALFSVSGFSGLIYESVWSHYIKLFLGHAAYAQTLVLVVFIGGLAIGAWICARAAERWRNPLRAYAMVEGATGLIALVFHNLFVAATDWGYAVLLPSACQQVSTFCMPQWGLSALLILPQSILLGMTFPLMSSAVLRRDTEQPGHHIAALYFLNSFGAVLGVLASAFVLIPQVGLPGTLMTAGIANIVIGVVAYFSSKSSPPPLAAMPEPVEVAQSTQPRRLVHILLAVAFFTGLSSFIYEIVWIRMLSLVLGASTHSFELMLASFILGIALGGGWIRSRIDRLGDTVRTLAIVQLAMGLAAAATIPLYNGSFDFMAWMLSSLARTEGGYLFFGMASIFIALMVMLPATFCAGMTLPLITYRLLRSPTGERALGTVYAVNTLGSIIGVAIAVHLLLEAVGLRGSLIVGAAIDVGLGVLLLVFASPKRPRISWEAIAAVVVLVILATTFDIDPRRSSSGVFRTGLAKIPEGTTIEFHRDGKTATVDVVKRGNVSSIRTNGKPDAALPDDPRRPPTLDEYTMSLLAILPLGHNPGAKTAAVIGFGSGLSTSILLTSPNLQRVDTVEIEPAMVRGARTFGQAVDAAYKDPRSRIVIDDAKSYFARGRNRYDIIVSEPSNPWVSGVSSLFTKEFYARLSDYMNDGAVLCQWLHTYEMDISTLASILQAVSTAFPDFAIYSTIDSDIVVIARKGGAPGEFDPRVLDFPGMKPIVERLVVNGETVRRREIARWNVLGPYLQGYRSPINSDFYPFVDQRASRTRFTNVRVSELTELQNSDLPLMEMLGGSPPPGSERAPTSTVTVVEQEMKRAWHVNDVLLGQEPPRNGSTFETSDIAARLVRLWVEQCPAWLSFESMLPSLEIVAADIDAKMSPENASALWKRIGDSPCARKLTPEQRQWIELFDATAHRDAARMSPAAAALLRTHAGQKNPASEYAFFAAVASAVCLGDYESSKFLLENGAMNWVRPGVRLSEVRFLEALTLKGGPPPASCKPRP